LFSCAEFRTELSNLVDDEVSPQLRSELEHHLAECRTCQVLYDSTRKTLTIVTESGSFELPEALSERLVSRIMASVRKTGSE
jgi:anti-sigma factor RsiW